MPSITIREKDLTSAGNLEVTTNAVYIPGYSNMGPVNTPTMCETLEDFQLIFGSEPYKFRQDLEWPSLFSSNAKPTDKFYYEGEYEKSYIIAAELLKLGLPVLYERCADSATITDWTASKKVNVDSSEGLKEGGLVVTATSSGYASSLIKFTISKDEYVIDADEKGTYFVLSVSRSANTDYGITAIDEVQTKFTFNKKLSMLYSSCILAQSGSKFVDTSGLVELKFDCKLDSDSSINDYLTGDKLTVYTLELNTTKETVMKNDVLQDEFTVTGMYSYLSENGQDDDGEIVGFDRLLDNGEYAIKFITSGAYPTYEYNDSSIASSMILAAANKGNCTALIDHTPNNDRKLQALNTTSVYNTVANGYGKVTRKNELGEDAHTYAAMFTPYGIYECTTVAKDVMLPASFGYLAAYAAQIQQYNGWLATAGCTRGLVPNLKALCQNVTNAIADSYQPRDGVAINAITNIKPYGLTIWGARTLKDNAKKGDLTATSFLNIRQLTNDVKRTTWVSAKTLTYEQNNDMLWIKFKMNITPLLNQMISGSAISSYEFKRQSTTKKATVKAVIRLYAIEPVEDWDITIELADSSTEIIG